MAGGFHGRAQEEQLPERRPRAPSAGGELRGVWGPGGGAAAGPAAAPWTQYPFTNFLGEGSPFLRFLLPSGCGCQDRVGAPPILEPISVRIGIVHWGYGILTQQCPFPNFFGWEGSPTKRDYKKRGTLILASLLENLDKEFGRKNAGNVGLGELGPKKEGGPKCRWWCWFLKNKWCCWFPFKTIQRTAPSRFKIAKPSKGSPISRQILKRVARPLERLSTPCAVGLKGIQMKPTMGVPNLRHTHMSPLKKCDHCEQLASGREYNSITCIVGMP